MSFVRYSKFLRERSCVQYWNMNLFISSRAKLKYMKVNESTPSSNQVKVSESKASSNQMKVNESKPSSNQMKVNQSKPSSNHWLIDWNAALRNPVTGVCHGSGIGNVNYSIGFLKSFLSNVRGVWDAEYGSSGSEVVHRIHSAKICRFHMVSGQDIGPRSFMAINDVMATLELNSKSPAPKLRQSLREFLDLVEIICQIITKSLEHRLGID